MHVNKGRASEALHIEPFSGCHVGVGKVLLYPFTDTFSITLILYKVKEKLKLFLIMNFYIFALSKARVTS